ncbi:hypothetical protein GO003_022470 [Methylicorpusculum oleiharenae]|uniref:hypothetical protein n=1 Tax=Methylicorpusculum oleiharenae TaxID=1338687 RepID=UPI00135721AC|nr:hypothetical protein [Methylicorpusculum oleiharenae]MCD2453151.1 hypothetical protein [Methylicorpusculum oleiharenae]
MTPQPLRESALLNGLRLFTQTLSISPATQAEWQFIFEIIGKLQSLTYTHRRSKFGTGVPVKGRLKYIHVGSYASIHAGIAFAEQPVASLGTDEI